MKDEKSLSNRQFNKLVQAVNGLSENLAKWQATQDKSIREGLAAIARAIAERDSTTLATGKLKDARTLLEDTVEANKP